MNQQQLLIGVTCIAFVTIVFAIVLFLQNRKLKEQLKLAGCRGKTLRLKHLKIKRQYLVSGVEKRDGEIRLSIICFRHKAWTTERFVTLHQSDFYQLVGTKKILVPCTQLLRKNDLLKIIWHPETKRKIVLVTLGFPTSPSFLQTPHFGKIPPPGAIVVA